MPNFKRIIASLLLVCAIATFAPQLAGAQNMDDTYSVAASADHTASAVKYSSFVRYSGHTGSLVIGCLEDGTKLTVLGTYGSFLRIDCYDLIGYIAISQTEQKADGEYYVNCKEGSSETKIQKTFTPQEALAKRGEIRAFSLKYQGVPYRMGGTTPYGFDCCGFTQYVFNNQGLPITRTVISQLQDGVIISYNDLQCGDLVFFQNTTAANQFGSHVGLYIGNGQMIHSGTGGVSVVDLNHSYFQQHYLCARRVIVSELPSQTVIPSVGINQNINSSYWRENSQTAPGLGNSFDKPIASI